MRPSSSQEISRPSMTTIGTRWSSSGSLSTSPQIKPSFTCGRGRVLQMHESQCSAHLADQLAQQFQRVVVRLPNHLKPIPGRAAIAQLERVDRHTGPEQSGAKPELVLDATPVDHAHGLEDHVLKPMQTEAAGGGVVEASAAKLPVAALRRPVVHDIVAERGLTAGVAGDWLHGYAVCV